MKKRSMSEKLLAIILGYTIVVTVFNIVCFFVDSWIVYIENPVISKQAVSVPKTVASDGSLS